MTCAEEVGARRTKPRYYCSLEAWKRNTEEAKKLHDSVRPLIIQKQRLEMAKNYQRYIDEQMKKYAEQQARHRDVPTAMPSQMQQIPPSRFALAPGSGYNYPVNAMNPNISNGPLNPRKRMYPDGEPGWPQYEMPMNRCANGGDLTQYPQQPGIAPNLQQKDMSLPIQKVSTTPSMCSMPVATSSTANDLSCNPLLKSLVTSTPASASSIGLIGSENTEVRNLMDQIDPTHSLNDLGDGCLDGILNGPNDDCAQQPSTSGIKSFDEPMGSPVAAAVTLLGSTNVASPHPLTPYSLLDGRSPTASSSTARNSSLSSENPDSVLSRRDTPESYSYPMAGQSYPRQPYPYMAGSSAEATLGQQRQQYVDSMNVQQYNSCTRVSAPYAHPIDPRENGQISMSHCQMPVNRYHIQMSFNSAPNSNFCNYPVTARQPQMPDAYHSVNNGGGMPIPQQQHFPANYMPQSQPYFPANNPAYRNT